MSEEDEHKENVEAMDQNSRVDYEQNNDQN
jgi:hypothetical protein